MRGTSIWTVVAIVGLLPAAGRAGDQDCRRLMVDGKLQSDLGRHEEASKSFRAIADDETAPSSLRWEALVRLGLARSAAGDAAASVAAFRAVRVGYSGDPDAMRFLTRAVTSVPGKIWIDFKPRFEDLLRTARVVSSGELGPAMRSRKLELVQGEVELSAVWKPFSGEVRGFQVSYQSEVAAYEIDKMLGLDMVPPTVLRTREGQEGSLQLWVHGCESYSAPRAPDTPEWRHELSRARVFDYLIGNDHRHAGNTLVDPSGGIVLVDNGPAFVGLAVSQELPQRFDRRMLEGIRALDRSGLEARLKGLLTAAQVEGIVMRRDALLTDAEARLAEEGEEAVLF